MTKITLISRRTSNGKREYAIQTEDASGGKTTICCEDRDGAQVLFSTMHEFAKAKPITK